MFCMVALSGWNVLRVVRMHSYRGRGTYRSGNLPTGHATDLPPASLQMSVPLKLGNKPQQSMGKRYLTLSHHYYLLCSCTDRLGSGPDRLAACLITAGLFLIFWFNIIDCHPEKRFHSVSAHHSIVPRGYSSFEILMSSHGLNTAVDRTGLYCERYQAPATIVSLFHAVCSATIRKWYLAVAARIFSLP